MNLRKVLYPQRFTIFLVSLIAILFGSLIVPPKLQELVFGPLFFGINILAGTLLISKKKGQRKTKPIEKDKLNLTSKKRRLLK